MTYTRNKPNSGKAPNLDAPTIQDNFATFQTVFSKNHLAINAANQGDHSTVIFQNQLTFPGVAPNTDYLISHNATSKGGTQPQLFVKIPKFLPTANDPTNATNSEMQLTFNTVNLVGPNQFQSFLIGGYLIYFGTTTGNTVNNVITSILITLVPAPTEIIVAIATPNTMTNFSPVRPFDVKTQINSNSTFTISSVANSDHASIPYSFGWVAIARA